MGSSRWDIFVNECGDVRCSDRLSDDRTIVNAASFGEFDNSWSGYSYGCGTLPVGVMTFVNGRPMLSSPRYVFVNMLAKGSCDVNVNVESICFSLQFGVIHICT